MTTWNGPEHTVGTSLRGAAPAEHWQEAAATATGTAPTAWTMFASGSDVVLGSHEAVFKMTHPRWATELETEAAMLRRVAGRLAVTTPVVLDRGRLDGWPWLLLSRVPGVPLADVWPTLDHAARLRVAQQLGELLATLHGLDVPPGSDATWDAFVTELREGAADRHLRHGCPPALAAQIEPYLSSVRFSRAPAVWLHTEVLDQHVFVETTDAVVDVVSLLDFADGRCGHPGYEMPAVAEFIFRGEPGLMRALLESLGHPALPPGRETARELVGWGLTHQFGSVKRMLAACGEPAPADFDEIALRLYDGGGL